MLIISFSIEVIAYASKIINWHLQRHDPKSTLANKISNLASPVSDFRMLLRWYGLIPMTQWIIYSEAHPSSNATIQFLTRCQNVANLCYYPLEVLHSLTRFIGFLTSSTCTGLHLIMLLKWPLKKETRLECGLVVSGWLMSCYTLSS